MVTVATLWSQVIYHLNNRNEDVESDLQDLSDKYDNDVHQLQQDTAAKVVSLTQQLQQEQQAKEQLAVTVQVITR